LSEICEKRNAWKLPRHFSNTLVLGTRFNLQQVFSVLGIRVFFENELEFPVICVGNSIHRWSSLSKFLDFTYCWIKSELFWKNLAGSAFISALTVLTSSSIVRSQTATFADDSFSLYSGENS
jgi:hypothetical protein